MFGKIRDFLNSVNGKKTVSGAVLLVFAVALRVAGLIDDAQLDTIANLALGIMGIGVGHKVWKNRDLLISVLKRFVK